MRYSPADIPRRRLLKLLGAGAIAEATSTTLALAADRQPVTHVRTSAVPVLIDGHVHVTNRVYWEKIDPWQPHDGGWDYARAWAAGVNCIIDDIGTYGYWHYNYTPKQTLRLIETFLSYAEAHADKMAVALSVADARAIIASGRMAVFLGNESGWDHEGDPAVFAAFFRLGLRVVQFATKTGFNAFSDSALAATNGQSADRYHGINDRGRALVALGHARIDGHLRRFHSNAQRQNGLAIQSGWAGHRRERHGIRRGVRRNDQYGVATRCPDKGWLRRTGTGSTHCCRP